jgi:hypothetical protein
VSAWHAQRQIASQESHQVSEHPDGISESASLGVLYHPDESHDRHDHRDDAEGILLRLRWFG